MRREAAFSLLGFLGGFVVAALVFWRPPESGDGGQDSAARPAEAAGRREHEAGKRSEQGRRPVVIPAENPGPPEPLPVAEAAPKRPADLFHEALAALPGMDASRRQAAVNELIKKLRAAGPEGLQAIRDFFRAGQDVKFQNGYTMANGRMTLSPSLRAALLDALGDWPGTDAVELTREVLRSTPRMFEAAIAIRQLEAKSPGVYRAEALQTLQQLASEPQGKDGMFDGASTLFDALGYFKAAELIPAAEKLLEKNGWAAFQYAQALEKLSPDVRGPAIERLFTQPGMAKQLANNPWALPGMNFSDPLVSQNVAQLFANDMDRKARESFLQNFGTNRAVFAAGSAFDPGAAKGAATQPIPETARVAQLQSKLAFLDQIAPQCTTAVLQERLQDAREDVKKAIAQPPPQTLIKGGSGILQLGGGGGGGGSVIFQSDGTSIGTTVIRTDTIDVKPVK